jgi:hypothetical protein
MVCWSGSSPAWCTPIQIVATLSGMSVRLLIVVILYYVLLYWIDGLEDSYCYDYHGYYWLTLLMMLITLLMLVLCML